MKLPTFHIERALYAQGYQAIVGVDEAGCGALAGPLVAADVIFPLDSRLSKVRDCKLLNPKMRDELYGPIIERSVAWSVGVASVEEIAQLGLRPANLLAMRRAVDGITPVDYVLVDAWTIPGLSCPQRGIIRGDQTVKSIAAASVIAKVTRDRLMVEFSRQFPEYGFDLHKGYGTKAHQIAIRQFGPCPIHRLGFKTFS